MAKTITQLPDATVVNSADELIIQQGGVTKRATKTEVLNGIVNANIDAAAAIAHSKLAALNSAQLLVGNGSNVPTAVSVTGDVTISNAGVTAIGSAKVLPAMLSQPYTLATAQASTSGTEIDFTGIPSWVKRITVMFDGVSTSGTSVLQVQIGAGSITASGYSSIFWYGSTGSNVATSGFHVSGMGAAYAHAGIATIANVSGNSWVFSSIFNTLLNTSVGVQAVGTISLGGTLDRVRITTVNGTDTFDAGSINIAYEG